MNFSPHYVEAYCNIGVILKNLGKLEEGISYYQKALKINPNFQIAKNNLAIALTDLGTTLKNQGKIKVTFFFILRNKYFHQKKRKE